MANIITFELCAEDRARLDRLAAALEKTGTAPAAPAPVKKEEPAPATEPAKEEKPAKKEPAPAPAAEPVKEEPNKEEPAHTLADVRALAQTMLAPGSNKRAQVKEIVRSYAPKISDIPADKVEEAWQKLNKLKGADA